MLPKFTTEIKHQRMWADRASHCKVPFGAQTVITQKTAPSVKGYKANSREKSCP